MTKTKTALDLLIKDMVEIVDLLYSAQVKSEDLQSGAGDLDDSLAAQEIERWADEVQGTYIPQALQEYDSITEKYHLA